MYFKEDIFLPTRLHPTVIKSSPNALRIRLSITVDTLRVQPFAIVLHSLSHKLFERQIYARQIYDSNGVLGND